MKIFGFLMAALSLGFYAASAQPFTKQHFDLKSLGSPIYTGVQWVDLNQDGVLDIFQVYSGIVTIYENQSGTFVERSHNLYLFDLNFRPDYYVLKDYDGDADIDILVEKNSEIKLAINDGNLDFTIHDIDLDLIATDSGPIHWQDVDADQDLDIIATHKIFINNQGNYTKSIFEFPSDIQETHWADINNDGLVDMIGALGYDQVTDRALLLYLNQGDGNFVTDGSAIYNSYGFTGVIKLMDADADEDLDVMVVSPSQFNPTSSLFRNMLSETGLVTWTQAFSFEPIHNPTASVGDINLDGLPDIVLSSAQETTYLYLNTSAGDIIDFLKTDLEMAAHENLSLQMVDIDGDYDLDIHFRGLNRFPFNIVLDEGIDSLFINTTVSTKPAPTIPINLNTDIQQDVVLSWDAIPGHLYNVQIKRNGTVLRSASCISSGALLNPVDGSLLPVPSLRLINLEEGTYTWQVEAVDYSYRTSGFSGTQVFTINPALNNLSVSILNFTTAKLEWTFPDNTVSFAIFRAADDQSAVEIARVPGNTFTFTDNNLDANKKFEYFIKTVSSTEVYSAKSNIVSFNTSQFIESAFAQINPSMLSNSGLAGDLDGDGDYDFEFIGWMDNSSVPSGKFLNNAQGSFTFYPNNLPPEDNNFPYTKLLDVIDVDRDGDMDLTAIIGSPNSASRVAVFLNDSGNFVKGYQSPPYLSLEKASFFDFNHDGLVDFFMKHALGNNSAAVTYELYLQNNLGYFTVSPIRFSPEITELGNFELVDINQDSFTDILFRGYQYHDTTTVFLNVNGRAVQKQSALSKSVDFIHFLDSDADGILDYITRAIDGTFQIHRGLGNGVFASAVPFPITGPIPNIDVLRLHSQADLNLDGLPDLIVSNDRTTYMLNNTSSGNFELADVQFKSNEFSSVILTDLENDGDLDILKTGFEYAQGLSHIYKNQISTVATNQPPSAPGIVNPVINAGHVTFSWQPASDDHTPQTLLSYNLWVQDSNGKSWLHSETNNAGTFRRRLAPGNAGYRTDYTINDLPAGTYTVKVQALDAVFQLSAWSDVNTFTLQPGPTDLNVERVLLNKVNLTWTASLFAEQVVVLERKSIDSDYELVVELPAGTTSYTDEGLTFNTIHTYRVYERSGSSVTTVSNQVDWNTNQWAMITTDFPNLGGYLDVGDYTRDGKMDMVVNGFRIYNSVGIDHTKATLENTDAGLIKQDITGSSLGYNSKILFFDINGDYKLDLFQYGYNGAISDYQTEIFLNNGDKTFTQTTNQFTTGKHDLQSVYDYDTDNDLDIFVIKNGKRIWLENKDDGLYQYNPVADQTCNSCPVDVAAGDFDGDGDEDIFRIRPNGGIQLLLKTFKGYQANTILTASFSDQIKTMDINNDGLLDVLILVNDHYSKSRLYQNMGLSATGEVIFQLVRQAIRNSIGLYNVQMMHTDFDHDGDDDMITMAPSATIYSNDGHGYLKPYSFPEYQIKSNSSKLIDFDHDGDLDIYLMGSVVKNYLEGVNDPKSRVLVNQTIVNGLGVTNLGPAVPTSLQTNQDTLGMHLTWTAPSDDHTTSLGLTYDIVLYKNGKAMTGASIDPISGMALTLVPGRHAGKALIRNLPYGDYTWKVQAIDQSFLRSPLSSEGSFTYRPIPPLIQDTTIYRCGRTISLTAIGDNIEWYSDSALANKLASGEFHPTTTQSVYVTQTINGVRGLPRFVTITIHEKPALPTILGLNPVLFCESSAGTPISLTAQGKNIRWYTDQNKTNLQGASSSIQVQSIETSYFATQTISGCESDVTKVDVKPLLINSELYFENERIYTRETNGQNYDWYKNDVLYYSGTNPYIEYDGEVATYYVIIKKYPCEETSQQVKVTGVENDNINQMAIYPNPVQQNQELHVSASFAGTLRVFDIKGKLIFEQEIAPEIAHKISFKTWNSGVYLFSIDGGKKIRYKRVILR